MAAAFDGTHDAMRNDNLLVAFHRNALHLLKIRKKKRSRIIERCKSGIMGRLLFFGLLLMPRCWALHAQSFEAFYITAGGYRSDGSSGHGLMGGF